MSIGKFIVFEGIDGSGKSTQIDLLNDYLVSKGHDVLVLREPGSTPLSERIREIILHKHDLIIDPRAEALLFSAARVQLVSEIISPALHSGKIVLCDRFSDSTIAYQGFGRELPPDEVISIQKFATQGLEPDLRILFDLPIDLAASRRDNSEDDRMESAGLVFLDRVRRGYLSLVEDNPTNWLVIDAGKDVAGIAEEIKDFIEQEIFDAS